MFKILNIIVIKLLHKYILDKNIFIICTDQYKMKRLSIKYLNKNKCANVLTFCYEYFSEIFISYINVLKNLKINNAENELNDQIILFENCDLIIHSICNVCKDMSDEIYFSCVDKLEDIIYTNISK